jgi:adenine phosphoribosyltransferase
MTPPHPNDAVDVELARELDALIAEVNGHADIWQIFLSGERFARMIQAMAAPFAGAGITKVVSVEARGFLLGGAVAFQLRAGFAAIRKGGHLPGPKLIQPTAGPDYQGRTHALRLQTAALRPGDRVLLVDDWIEIGSQAGAAVTLIRRSGATYAGCSVIVNQLPEARVGDFAPLRYLVRHLPRET